MTKFYKPNNSRILYLNSSFNCIKNSSINLTRTSGGTGYTSVPTIQVISASNDMGSGCTATATVATGAISAITVTNNGKFYNTLPTIQITGGGNPGVITNLTITNGGSGYNSPPTISASGGAGSGFSATATVAGGVITALTIISGGKNYTSTPTIVITPTNGGTGAVITPTINVGTAAVITPSFLRTYSYTWTVPDIEINDLAKLSTVNIVASGTTATTPYTYRINGLRYDSRNSYFSDYGSPILSIAQTTNICSYGSLSNENFSIILQPQTIKEIQISVDDSLITQNAGQLATINFVIAIEIEEYDPNYTQVGDVYAESAARIKPMI